MILPPHPLRAATAAGRDSPRRSPRRAAVTGLLAIALVVIGGALWTTLARIDSALVLPGLVEPQTRKQIIQHASGGRIEAVMVRDGSEVSAGDLLLRLDASVLRHEAALNAARLHEVLARSARMEAELASRPHIAQDPEIPAEILAQQQILLTAASDLARHRRERARQQRLQLTAQIAGIDAQIEAAAAQHRLIGAELDDQRHLLARGLTPAPRVRGLEREWSAAAGQLGELEALRAATELRITELDEALAQAEAEHRRAAETELRELSHQSRELREQAAAITSQLADLELRAPIDGIIHQLQVTGQGAVLRPAEPVMWIVPQAAPVVVSARVPAARIGEISPGQSARLSPRGHYWQDKPGLRGHISAISADAIADDPSQQGHFRIEVTLDETAPPDAPVIPGLTADLFIVTGTRSPLDYLATPLTRHFGRAMREL